MKDDITEATSTDDQFTTDSSAGFGGHTGTGKTTRHVEMMAVSHAGWYGYLRWNAQPSAQHGGNSR